METKSPIPLAILVGIQTPEVDDVAHAASLEELGRLVKTLGYDVVGTVSQRREGAGAGLLLGSGKLAELAALTARDQKAADTLTVGQTAQYRVLAHEKTRAARPSAVVSATGQNPPAPAAEPAKV